MIDVHLGDSGEVIANIPIRVSAKATFSQFSISPLDDVNFGSILINSKKQNTLTITNKGDFELKYSINKQLTVEQQKHRQMSMAAAAAKNRIKSRERVTSARSTTNTKTTLSKILRAEGPVRYVRYHIF